MRKTSPHTRDLIQQLRGPTGWQDYRSLLSEIADSNEPAAIVDILPLILYRSEIAFAAAAALHKLLLGTTTSELAWFDSALRSSSTYLVPNFYEWHKISEQKIDELERFGNASFSLIALATFHQNGYVREAAITKLSLVTTGAELPFLILRLNDWVSNVRAAAYKAVRSRIKLEYCRPLIESQPLISRLEYAGRADHKEIVNRIHQLLHSDECRTALLESLKSKDRYIRRASFTLAMDSTKPDLEHVVTLALNDEDTMIRRWAAQKVASSFDGETLGVFVRLMKRNRFMPVRREALRIVIKSDPDHAIEELQNAMLDSHQSMREESRYLLQRIQPIDVAALYRQHLVTAQDTTLPSAISGLGETGRAEDDEWIVPYATHPSSKIRSTAIRALTKLNRRAHVGIFLNALKDEVPRVSRQAQNALAKKGSWLNPAPVWEIFKSASQVHVKRNAISVIEQLSKWESITLLIRALSDSDEGIVVMSSAAIDRWMGGLNRRFFSTPTHEQLQKLMDALAECGDDNTKHLMLFLMKGFD